jgi:fluoride ion exporter CrcB/FEX
MRDTFLALANDLPSHEPRNGGYSALAVLAVPIITLSLSLSALFLGAHLAIALAPWTPALPRGARTVLDRASVLLGWGGLVGAGLVYGYAPEGGRRAEVALALAYAPVGCVLRFVTSLWLNAQAKSFPVGTFVANMVGTAVLAAAWSVAHSSPGGGEGVARGVRVCELLGAVQDGFCGCLTTVSTFVVELAALRRRHAYVYGGASVLGGLVVVVAIMGSLRWGEGYEWEACG